MFLVGSVLAANAFAGFVFFDVMFMMNQFVPLLVIASELAQDRSDSFQSS